MKLQFLMRHPTEWLRQMGLGTPAQRLEWFPPYRRMGVKVLEFKGDWDLVRVRLPLIPNNQRPGGLMFGGCMASLADSIAALACQHRFPGYGVWTRSLVMDFLKEGTSDLELRFEFDPDIDAAIREALESRGRCTPQFSYGFYRADGELCAKVESSIAIRQQGPKEGLN